MHASDLNPTPDLTVPTIPVICDSCKASGMAGDAAFAAIPDILDFTPVPRRAHANNWTPEHQRAFIAALAITGSPRQAARAIGRHAYGAEQLKTARGGKSFAAAWEAAMEIARDREVARIHTNLADLANQSSPPLGEGPGEGLSGRLGAGPHALHPDCPYDPEIHTEDYPEYWEARNSIRDRLLSARRLLLFLLAEDEEKRRAWEVLVGPTDWDRARKLEAQDDEPIPGTPMNPEGLPNMRDPDMLLTVEAGLLSEFTGGEDVMTELVQEALRIQASESTEDPDSSSRT